MTTFPLLTHPHAEDVLAYSHGKPITVAHFLADVRQLAAALPPGRHILNTCSDRYRFAVGMAASLLADKISLLPPTLTPEMVRQVKSFAPDVFCLTDQPQSIDLPQCAWADAVTERAPTMAGAQADTRDIPEIPASRTARPSRTVKTGVDWLAACAPKPPGSACSTGDATALWPQCRRSTCMALSPAC
jgi:hypothetical protein